MARLLLVKRLSLFFALTTALTLNFAFNSFDVVDERWFESHQRGTESHVVGRIVQSRREGMLSHGGLLGIAEWVYERCISLPIYPDMSDQDVGDVIGQCRI